MTEGKCLYSILICKAGGLKPALPDGRFPGDGMEV